MTEDINAATQVVAAVLLLLGVIVGRVWRGQYVLADRIAALEHERNLRVIYETIEAARAPIPAWRPTTEGYGDGRN